MINWETLGMFFDSPINKLLAFPALFGLYWIVRGLYGYLFSKWLSYDEESRETTHVSSIAMIIIGGLFCLPLIISLSWFNWISERLQEHPLGINLEEHRDH